MIFLKLMNHFQFIIVVSECNWEIEIHVIKFIFAKYFDVKTALKI
jgi:hypothetical protein